jgi:hypothetical protein
VPKVRYERDGDIGQVVLADPPRAHEATKRMVLQNAVQTFLEQGPGKATFQGR